MIDSLFAYGLFQTLLLLGGAATLLLPISWAVVHVFNQSTAAKRFAIWQGVFAGLLLLPLAIIALPKLNLGYDISHARIANSPVDSNQLNSQRSRQRPSQELGRELVDLVETGKRTEIGTHGGLLAPSNGSTNTPTPTNFEKSTTGQTESTVTAPASAVRSISWRFVLSIAWLGGFASFGLRLLLSHLAATRIARHAAELPSEILLSDLGCRRNKIKLSNKIASPVTVGVLRPRVLLPLEATDWPADQLRMVLAHELAHVDRHDVFWQLLASVTKAIYWFHPLVWYAESAMKLERELACDDQVLSMGEVPSDYSKMLIRMATALSSSQPSANQSSNLLGVSISQKPIETRVASILAVSKKRSSAGLTFKAASLLAVGCLALTVGVVRPFASPVDAAQSPDTKTPITDQDQVSLPSHFQGRVLDDDGKPVANATVELRLMPISDKPSGSMKGVIKTLSPATTNEAGEYEIPTGELRVANKKCHIGGFIKADGFPHYKPNIFIKNIETAGQFEDVKMKPGRLITGRVIAPAHETDLPIDVVIRLTGDAKLSSNSWRWESATIACDREGRFEAHVPKVGRVELDATAENYAGVQVPVPQDIDELDVQLAKGTSVFGKVLGDSGQPVAGAFVNMSGVMENDLSRINKNPMFSPLHSSVTTDNDGRFRLPPFVGRTRIFLARSGRERTQDDHGFTDQMPVILPQVVELDGSQSELELNLRSGPTTKLSGTIRWQDGSPAGKVNVRAYIMCGGSSVDVDKTNTNELGQYSVEVPSTSEENSAGLMVTGAIDDAGSSKIAYPETKIELLSQREQSMSFKTVAHDLSGLDWELRDRAVPVTTAKVDRHDRTDADVVLEELGTRFNARNRPYDSAEYCRELLKLESDYRGEFASVLALREVLSQTSDEWPEPINNQFYRQSMERLAAHYITHQDVEFCAELATGQLYNPEAINFLKRLQSESPHEHVRAAAHFFEFSHLAEQLRNYRMLEQANWKFDAPAPDDWDADQLRNFQQQQAKFIDKIKSLDSKTLRDDLGTLNDKLSESFKTVKRSTLLGHIGSVVFDRYQSADAKTYAATANAQLQVLDAMQIGSVPKIIANDPFGKPFRLSDLQGKVVLVFFSSNWHHPRQRKFYQTFRDLKSKHEDSPFEIVTVLVDTGVEYAKEPINDGNITWQAIWDDGEVILKAWDVRALTSNMYLLDHQGLLRGRFYDESDPRLETMMKELIDDVSVD